MSKNRKIFLVIFALFIVALNIGLYAWAQSLQAEEVPYLVDIPVEGVAFDGQGRVWVYGEGELKVYENGVPIRVFTKKDSPALGGDLQGLIVDNKGRAWVAPWGKGRTVDLAVFDGTKWSTLRPRSADRGVIAIAIDTQGRAWIGVDKQGLYLIDGETQINYTVENSDLVSDEVECIAFDKQGRAWLGTRGRGLSIFDGEVWQTINTANSEILDNWNYAIAFDQEGRAWIASGTIGISVFDGQNWTSYKDLAPITISEIVADARGRVWANNASVFDGEMRKYYFDPSHLSHSLTADADGNIWIPNDKAVVIITPDSPQPLSYSTAMLSFGIASGSLIYLTILLICIWLSVALNAWRSIGVGLASFPLYLVFVLSSFDSIPFSKEYYQISRFVSAVNPGTLGAIGGMLGGTLEILLTRTGKAKTKRMGLIGFIIGSGLGICLLIANMAQ